ncbi:phenylacetate--CoA ligase [Methanosarcinaceae archaeon]|nr:phenylacetate--CoA ligase [Methanosarcinaceae archaeon]MBQ3620087.1 phenylacetate--CoA ligase [Methanosarcinaceae archaeon]
MDPESLRKLQSEKLVKLINYVYDRSPFYRKRFEEAGIKPEDIRSIDDLTKLPFTFKKDLRDTYPTGMFCVPPKDVVRIHASSGTTGKPTVVGYTENDLDCWSESLARAMTSAGLNGDDIIQVSYGYGLFTGGLGAHYGSEKIGATTVPAGTGNSERQIMLMQDLGVTGICCTPSYFSHLIEVAANMGVDFRKDTKLRVGLFGAEPWSEELRKHIEERSGIKAYDIFGTSELSGPLFTDCEKQNGIHIWGDMFIVEVVDPKTGKQVPDGEKGELVVTTLTKEALPLIRYRVGDLTSMTHETCACGRTHPRILRLTGRTDDMTIVRGINVFPGQVEAVLLATPGVTPNFRILIDRVHELDTMTVQVELNEENFSEKMSDLFSLKSEIERKLQSILNLSAKVEFVEIGTIPRYEGKAKRIIDNRKL